MNQTNWHFPGSRWWKFDFHTHTPASKDTAAWQQAINTPDEVTPEKWLRKYMAAGIDCVAVTDHNSGAWIDKLKAAYSEMKNQAAAEQASEGFRELFLFPGVEISVNSGVHVLAIFDTDATTRTITDLLARVEYQGTDGDSDGVTKKSAEEVITQVLHAGGIPIPAHADKEKGLFALDSNTLKQALEVEGLLAVEWCASDEPSYPLAVQKLAQPLARVLGSDCHNFQQGSVPGSRYTWVKMAAPSLEGLRLALLDGNGVSIRRSDEGDFDPFAVPAHIITAIEIKDARYMGQGETARLEFSPYFNAVVGGRGTGKSTLIHALRLATQRKQELTEKSEPRAQFDAFCVISKNRDDKGALRQESAIYVEWQHDDARLRLRWQDNGPSKVEEWRDGEWQISASQSVNSERFPLRMFSQGQIATLAGSGRQELLSIIDQAANIQPLHNAFAEAERTFSSQQARLRELEGRLKMLPEIERKLSETAKKLATLAQSNHAAILLAYTKAQHQIRGVNRLREQLQQGVERIKDLPDHLLLDNWPSQHFTTQDADLLAWRQEIDQKVVQLSKDLLKQAEILEAFIQSKYADARYAQWRASVENAKQRYNALQAQFATQGVNDPQAYTRLTHEHQQLETQSKEFKQLQNDRQTLQAQIESQKALLLQKRQAITSARQKFLADNLKNNPHVQMEVVPFGLDAQQLERELRALLDVTDGRFAADILGDDNKGIAADLAQADVQKKVAVLNTLKQRLLNPADTGSSLSWRFRTYLTTKHEKPAFGDDVWAWFPQDDLRIEYRRDSQWVPIEQGSQGQRSAALLAFLLAFGKEPLVLDQPEDDLDNHLIYDLIVQQIRENKLRRQLIIVTHNPNVVVNGDAELVHVMEFGRGQCFVKDKGALQDKTVRSEVCRVMEGGRDAFARRWKRLGREV